MILDSSAFFAVVFEEPGFEVLLDKLLAADSLAIGSPTLTEATIVLSSRIKKDARGMVARFLMEAGISIVPFDEIHFGTAVDAWLLYGKGRHPAALNFGDCLAYATAKIAAEPLLCTGSDFAKTDLDLA
jgi:ribonuclease VapC